MTAREFVALVGGLSTQSLFVLVRAEKPDDGTPKRQRAHKTLEGQEAERYVLGMMGVK